MKKTISLMIFALIFMTGCLTPYDNEFTCKPSIIGNCTQSVVETYKQTLKDIDQKEIENEKNN